MISETTLDTTSDITDSQIRLKTQGTLDTLAFYLYWRTYIELIKEKRLIYGVGDFLDVR